MQFNIADLFECVADAVPDRVAVVARDRRVRYRELDERTNRLAHALAGLGVRPDDHVGCCMGNTIAHVETILACFKLRAVPVNVNHRYVEPELAYLFDDADLVGVLYDRVAGDRVRVAGAHLRFLLDVDEPDYDARLAGASPARDFGPRAPDDRYLLYTGGTTGMPKGVVWRHEDIFFAALGGGNPGGAPIAEPAAIARSVRENPAQRLRPFLAAGDDPPRQLVALALGPLVHASGQWSALGTLLGGGCVVLYDRPHVDMEDVLDLVQREGVNALNLVGDASARPLLAALRAHPGRWDTSGLRLLGSGGTMLSGDVKDALMDALPSVRAIVEGVGSSESPAQAVAVTTRAGGAPPSLTFAAKPETIVVDGELRPVRRGSGAVGLLATKGRVPLGYHKDDARSARTFVEIDGERWSLPGDMATIDADGTVHLLGRGTMCINTGGEKVYPEEVEAVLKRHPAIDDAVVVGVADERLGETVVAIVACARAGRPPSLEDLQAHCRAALAGYKLPRRVHAVERIERTAAGKADYRWARRVVAGERPG